MIEEHHTYALQANGDTIEEVKRGSLTEAAQRVILQTKTDASGRRVGEMVNVYLGVWRTWEYDALGRLAFERWMGSLSASTSTTMPPPPSPKRPTHRPIRCA